MLFSKLVTALAFGLLLSLSAPSAQAQDMPSQAEMEQLQQMMEQMMNDPAFQEQMQQMLGQEGMEEIAPLLSPDFMQGMNNYNNCLTEGLGQNWIMTMGQRFTPYMEQVERLCQAGRYNQAKNFLEDESNIERYFSSQEITVMERCEAQFPDQSMLEPDPSMTGEEICQEFSH